MLHAVVMAGGSGTRFWPQSRNLLPKQLLPLAGERTMIQQTLDRVAQLTSPDRCWIATGSHLVEETAKQLPQIPRQNFIVEPCGRNTAPCVGLAAAWLLSRDPDAEMLVMPADHVINPAERFLESVNVASGVLETHADHFLLFGVPPTSPATGFGYIHRGERLQSSDGVFQVEAFKEKPDLTVAKEYVEDGGYYWNCGIFVWRADRILAALEQFEPELHAGVKQIADAIDTPDYEGTLQMEFPKLKSISIDYAVLERAAHVAVIEAPFDWDDLGSWTSLPRQFGSDANGNTISAAHLGLETENCIIRGESDRLIATAGVSDLVIVQSGNATLVARRGDESAIREIVARLKAEDRGEFL